jgi:HD-like signal output (HDOD) protein
MKVTLVVSVQIKQRAGKTNDVHDLKTRKFWQNFQLDNMSNFFP